MPYWQITFRLILITLIGLMLAQIARLGSAAERIIYAAVDDRDVMNLWAVDLAALDQPEQLTFFDAPGYRFFTPRFSKNGRVSFMELVSTQPLMSSPEITLFDYQGRETRQITGCAAADTAARCASYAISADGRYVAYYQEQPTGNRLRLFDVETAADKVIQEFASNEPRFRYLAWLGSTTLFASDLPSRDGIIQIYDARQGLPVAAIPLAAWGRVHFSDDISRYAYDNYGSNMEPDAQPVRLTDDAAQPITEYVRWNLFGREWLQAPIADWHPDNRHLLIWKIEFSANELARRYMAVLDTGTLQLDYLSHNPLYDDSGGEWNMMGDKILFERHDRRQPKAGEKAHLMLYDVQTRVTAPLGIAGTYAHWIENRE